MGHTETKSKLENLYLVLKERIGKGVWSVGEQIPTEIELASEFGCSRSTVGKAIAQLVHAGLVERKTKSGTRVLRSNEQTARPDIELNAFAFIYPNDQHDTIWRLMKGFQAAAIKSKRRILMLPSGSDYRKEAELIRRLPEFDVKGAVVFPLIPSPEDAIYFARVISNCELPVVLIDLTITPLTCPTIAADEFHSGYVMTRHLIEQGSRRIGFLANYSHMPNVRDKYRGYLWALDEAGIKPNNKNILLAPNMTPDFENPMAESNALGKQLLSASDDMDTVVCANDYLALGCINAAQELGFLVPDDLGVVSCNDYGLLSPGGLKLTTYRIPHEELGRRSFEALDSLVDGKPFTQTDTVIRGRLIPGQTSRPGN